MGSPQFEPESSESRWMDLDAQEFVSRAIRHGSNNTRAGLEVLCALKAKRFTMRNRNIRRGFWIGPFYERDFSSMGILFGSAFFSVDIFHSGERRVEPSVEH